MTFAEQLKGQLDIVDVIGAYVRLKRGGGPNRYVGLCPFHSEKTPSFNVNQANQFYYCFGCQATGDVYKFVQEIESLTFPETLKTLAERYGIAMPQRSREDPETQRRAVLLEMHEIAADLFQRNLQSPAGAAARAYLEKRGLAAETINEFRLGLSDSSGQQLAQRLQKFPPPLLEESGLVKKREHGAGFFDVFRGRVMFPIHSESGEVIAFGGRALRDDDQPKYRNSSETRIYKKSTVLYNLHRAKQHARKVDRMVLVEGYMDAIGLYAAGVREVAAVCGTSLSNEQVRAIKRQIAQGQASSGTVILNFDPDAAGARSAEKYIGNFLAEGLRVRVLELPDNLDPDEYVQQFGVDEYTRRLDSAASFFHWLTDRARASFDLETAEGRVDAFRTLLPYIQLISDRVERSAIAGEVAEALKLPREAVAEQLKGRSRAAEPQRTPSIAAGITRKEIGLISSLVLSTDAREAIKHYLRNSSVLELLETKPVFDAVLQMDEPFSLERLSSALEPRFQRLVADIAFGPGPTDEDAAAQQALDYLQALENTARENQIHQLRSRVRELEKQGKVAEAMSVMAELDRMKAAGSGV